jgi:uncharacterized membrane protein
MGVDISSTWTSLQTLPWWAIPAIFVVAMLLTELCTQWWQRRRMGSHQRRWNEYSQRLREYHKHYKEALLSGQSLNKFNWLSSVAGSEL